MSTPRTTWTLPIRRWLVIALIGLFIVPAAGVVIVGSTVWASSGAEITVDAAAQLRADVALWGDPAWQQATSSDLTENGIDFVLYSDGREVYRTNADPLAETHVDRPNAPPWQTDGSRGVRRLVLEGTNPLLTADVYQPMSGAPAAIWVVPLTGGILLLITLTVLGVVAGRMLVRPLAATSRAAAQVAAGDLDVSLPASRVREVEEVSTAFESMSAGLRRSLEQQAELEQERRFFIGAVVHDLRTPLFSLRGYLEGLEKGLADTPEKQQHYIATAQDKAGALDRMVNDLFDYSRLEYLRRPPEKERFDLGSLLQGLVESLQPQAGAQGLALTFEQEATPCEVDADPHLLARVVENLLDNALRYTPSGGVVTVSCGRNGESVWLRVADTGPGILPADLPHLFAPLYRGESSRNRRTGGTGLGLTIAQRIMHAHGGDLSAENRRGGGTVFTASLTLNPTAETDILAAL
jgi:signal transduction histidine kinase